MALDPAQLRASLLWEAACERLRNALRPSQGMPESTPAQLVAALELAHGALEAVRQAYGISPGAAQQDGNPVTGSDAAPLVHRDLVAVGAAEGGLGSLAQLVNALPARFPAAVLVAVRHPADIDLLAEIKRAGSAVPVSYARDGQAIERGHIYLSPPNQQVIVRPSMKLGVETIAYGDSLNRIIDRLFESVADVYGQRAIGVILSGADGDGVDGMNAIEEADGIGIVQDPDEAIAADLPSHVISEDRPHYVAPMEGIASLLDTLVVRRGNSSRLQEDSAGTYGSGTGAPLEN